MLITIPGRPIPAMRMTQRGKWSKEAIRYLSYKDLIGFIAKPHFTIATKEAVKVAVTVYLHGKKTNMGNDGDADNYLKSALDGLNKIAFKDDRQVMIAIVTKCPCKKEDEQRMEIWVDVIKPQ